MSRKGHPSIAGERPSHTASCSRNPGGAPPSQDEHNNAHTNRPADTFHAVVEDLDEWKPCRRLKDRICIAKAVEHCDHHGETDYAVDDHGCADGSWNGKLSIGDLFSHMDTGVRANK